MTNWTARPDRPDHAWRAVMAHWLQSKSSLDGATIFSNDEYGLLNAAKFAVLVFNQEAQEPSETGNNQTLPWDPDGASPEDQQLLFDYDWQVQASGGLENHIQVCSKS